MWFIFIYRFCPKQYTRKKGEPVKWSSPLEYAFYVGLFVSTSKIVWVKHCHMLFYECCNIESLICWLTKHIWDIGLRLVVCWRRLLAKWKHWSSLRPLWPSYAPPAGHPGPPELCSGSHGGLGSHLLEGPMSFWVNDLEWHPAFCLPRP